MTAKRVKPTAASRAMTRAMMMAVTRTVRVKRTKRKRAGPVRTKFVRRKACDC